MNVMKVVGGRLVIVCAGTGQPEATLRLVGTTDDEDGGN